MKLSGSRQLFFNLIRNVNSDTAKIETEQIVELHPEYETDLKEKKIFYRLFRKIWLALRNSS